MPVTRKIVLLNCGTLVLHMYIVLSLIIMFRVSFWIKLNMLAVESSINDDKDFQSPLLLNIEVIPVTGWNSHRDIKYFRGGP